MQNARVLVLPVVVNLEIREHRLYVTVDVAVFDADLREYGELSCRPVESPISAQDIVHRWQIRVLDRDAHVECGSVLAGEKVPRNFGITAAHELAVKCQV